MYYSHFTDGETEVRRPQVTESTNKRAAMRPQVYEIPKTLLTSPHRLSGSAPPSACTRVMDPLMS